MSKYNLIPFDEAQERASRMCLGGPTGFDVLSANLLSQWVRQRVIHSRRRPSQRRPLVDWNGLRPLVAERCEAIRLKRTTSKPHREKGFRWIPLKYIEDAHGFETRTTTFWARGLHPCLWTGKQYEGRLWLALNSNNALHQTRFLREVDILEAKLARDSGVSPIRRRASRAAVRVDKRCFKNVNPRLWADTDEALELTRAKNADQLYYWRRAGFPAPDGQRLPLDHKRVRVEGSRGQGKAFWLRVHVDSIRKCRSKLRPADDHELTPYKDVNGCLWQRHRRMLREFDCNDSTAGKWAKKCSMLGNKPLVRRKIPGKHHFRAEEWGYRDDLYQVALAARRITKEQADEQDFFRDETGDRYVPLHLALKVLPIETLLRDAGPESDKPIHTRVETLPYRPDRPRIAPQKVYNEKHLRRHAAERRQLWGDPAQRMKNFQRGPRGRLLPLPAAGTNGNGQHAPALPRLQTASGTGAAAGLMLRRDEEYPLINGSPAKTRKLTLAEHEALTFCLLRHAQGYSRLRKDDLVDLNHPSRPVILRSLSKDPEYGRFIDGPNGQKGRGYAVVNARIST